MPEKYFLLFKFLLFLFYYILQLCFCNVSIIFCWKPYRTDPIRFKWILHIGSERNGSLNRTVKKNRSGYSPLDTYSFPTFFFYYNLYFSMLLYFLFVLIIIIIIFGFVQKGWVLIFVIIMIIIFIFILYH